MVKKSRRMGRPPKPAKERKKRNFTFRETEDFHRLIAASAKADNRKIGEQIVLLCREALQSRRQKLDIAATAHAVAEHFAVRMGGKPVVVDVDYTQDPDGALRVSRRFTKDQVENMLRRAREERGRESPTPKPVKTSKEGRSK
jgi:hypothetical protein